MQNHLILWDMLVWWFMNFMNVVLLYHKLFHDYSEELIKVKFFDEFRSNYLYNDTQWKKKINF